MMMFKMSVLALSLCVSCLHGVSGASFSEVYVQTGQEVLPAEYVQYGAPAVSKPSAQIAQISAAPVGSVAPVASSHNVISPCGTPCVYRGSISPVAQTTSPTPNIITYKSNVPVVVRNSEEPGSYEYSYVVYDDGTGDHKAQHESSDGGVVRGQYSFLQPDGYVREVHYTADDLKGFNAIVKKFLPVNVEAKNEKEKDHLAIPCHEVNQGHHLHDTHHEDSPPETQEAASSDEREEESNETIAENHDHSPKEIHEKPSEALTKVSVESSDEKESSEGILEAHELPSEHVIEPHPENNAEQEADAKSNHEINYESAEMTTHELKEDPSSYNIFKCVQNAIANNQIPAPLIYIILNSPC